MLIIICEDLSCSPRWVPLGFKETDSTIIPWTDRKEVVSHWSCLAWNKRFWDLVWEEMPVTSWKYQEYGLWLASVGNPGGWYLEYRAAAPGTDYPETHVSRVGNEVRTSSQLLYASHMLDTLKKWKKFVAMTYLRWQFLLMFICNDYSHSVTYLVVLFQFFNKSLLLLH